MNNKTFHNPYRKGSAMNPTFHQRERAIETYREDYPQASQEKAAAKIDELFRDFIEEHI